MKKITGLLLAFMLLVSCIVNVSAAEIGDVVNKTVYTDIVAKINGYDIASFNVDGYTVIVAEDLRNYGFNVEWIEAQRALYITRNENIKDVASIYRAPRISADKLGQKANDVLYTDIKTYMDGMLVTSYNIGGQTAVYFDDFKRYGTVSYDDSSRILTAKLPWINEKIAEEAEDNAFYRLAAEIEKKGTYNRALYLLKDEIDGNILQVTYEKDTLITFSLYVNTPELKALVVLAAFENGERGAVLTLEIQGIEVGVVASYEGTEPEVIKSDLPEINGEAVNIIKESYYVFNEYLYDYGIYMNLSELGFVL